MAVAAGLSVVVIIISTKLIFPRIHLLAVGVVVAVIHHGGAKKACHVVERVVQPMQGIAGRLGFKFTIQR